MIHLSVQIDCAANNIPSEADLRTWANQAAHELSHDADLCIRIVEPEEIQALNKTYRHKDKPTNVLSFPFDMEDIELERAILGDLVICPAVLQQEAIEQSKSLEAHWAHMVVHGTLHLLGYDHEDEADATIMEQLEIDILNKMGYHNPYEE